MMKDLFIKGLRIDWNRLEENSYLRRIPSLKGLAELQFDRNVTFFVGENGSGKSTLLEAIAVSYGFNPEGGTVNYRFSTYDDVSTLGSATLLIKSFQRAKFGYFFRAETFFNVATVNATRYNGENYHSRSHGEGFLDFLENADTGLYLMDEPEAALSPQNQLRLLRRIHQAAGKGAQFLIVTHSPILLGCPDAQILSFDNGSVSPCLYEDTESYRVTSLFLQRRESMLQELLSE